MARPTGTQKENEIYNQGCNCVAFSNSIVFVWTEEMSSVEFNSKYAMKIFSLTQMPIKF